MQRGVKTLCILNHWRRLQGTLPIQERYSWIIGYPHRIPRAHRQGVGGQNTCLAWRHYLRHKWNGRRTGTRFTGRSIQTTRGGTPIKWRENGINQEKLTWLGYHINQNGVKPIKDKTVATTKLKARTNTKELMSILGSIQHLSKFLNNFSKKTDRMRRLKKKGVNYKWTPETDDDFEQLIRKITEAPCLAHFDPKKDNYVTTDACDTGLGATLWQKEGEVFRPVAFASRFLAVCERKYAMNELELLGALWGLECFTYYVYGKKVNLLTDHQALQPL